MAKYKNQLIKLQFLVIFLIPLTPHIKITNFFQLDDLPVLLFLILFFVNIYTKNIQKIYFKEIEPHQRAREHAIISQEVDLDERI